MKRLADLRRELLNTAVARKAKSALESKLGYTAAESEEALESGVASGAGSIIGGVAGTSVGIAALGTAFTGVGVGIIVGAAIGYTAKKFAPEAAKAAGAAGRSIEEKLRAFLNERNERNE